MSTATYSAEFGKLYNKAKNYDMILSDGILAYKFLNKVSLSSQHQQLITVLGTKMLTVYKETSQQFINLPPELSIRSLIC